MRRLATEPLIPRQPLPLAQNALQTFCKRLRQCPGAEAEIGQACVPELAAPRGNYTINATQSQVTVAQQLLSSLVTIE
jgi:hypothetical protein